MSSSLQPQTSRVHAGTATQTTTSPPISGQNGAIAGEAPVQNLLRELRGKRYQRGSSLGTSMGSALTAIWANRTRSFLTMLGIVVGVAAVIGSLTLTSGVAAFITNIIASQGVNTIFVAPGSSQNTRGVTEQNTQTLTLNDLRLLSQLPHVSAISPIVSAGNMQVVFESQNWHTRVQGVSTDLQTIQGWQMLDGLWFTTQQQAGAEPVAVLGDTVAQNLFGNSNVNPVGQQIRIGNQLFRVVGVLAPKGGFGQDDVIFIPYQTAMIRLANTNYLSEIVIDVDDQNNINLVVQEITTTLESSHHIPKGTPDDFQTITSAQLLQQSQQVTQAIALLLSSIAAISLTVGGIGIMNIMLVSVTERTREIGIRLAIGARRADIRTQFLIEALVLSLLGGILGMLLGIFVGWLTINLIIAALARNGGGTVPLVITPTTLMLPFAVSAFIGIVFGLYPAVRASRLDPIVALRRAR
jgi:putative ABC transport system permease protein